MRRGEDEWEEETHIDLSQHGKRDSVVQLAELLNVVVAPWVLATELVAREANDLERVGVLRLEVLVQLLKTGELWGETALRSGVDDEHDFALQLGERELAAALWGTLVGAARVRGEGRGETYCPWA